MAGEEAPGCTYRLVLIRDGRRIVHATALQNYKQAVACVADAVRTHAGGGRVTGVLLERRFEHRPKPDATVLSPAWVVVEQWGSEVILRILRQNGYHHPAANQEPSALAASLSTRADRDGTPQMRPAQPGALMERRQLHPSSPPAAASLALPVIVPEQPAGERPRGHHWHFAAGLSVILIAWIAIAMVLAGGHLFRLLESRPASQPSIVKELPFTGPPQALGRPPATATSFPASSHPNR